MSQLVGHSDQVTAFAFDPIGGKGISVSVEQIVRVWEIGGGTAREVFDTYTSPIAVLAYRPDGTQFVSGASVGNLRFWEVKLDPALLSQMQISESVDTHSSRLLTVQEPAEVQTNESADMTPQAPASMNERKTMLPCPDSGGTDQQKVPSKCLHKEPPLQKRTPEPVKATESAKPTLVAHPPPPYTILAGKSLEIHIRADYPDRKALTLLHGLLPRHAIFDPDRHLFLWTPYTHQTRETRVIFTATAPDGETASLMLLIDVKPVNVPPHILRIGSLEITGDELPKFEVPQWATPGIAH